MREFYSAFDGIRESEPPVCGNFVPCNQVVTVRSEFSPPEDFPGLQKYAECPIICWAGNGDLVIQIRDGRFWGYVLSEDRIKRLAVSFRAQLTHYVKYRVQGNGYPFDSYGA